MTLSGVALWFIATAWGSGSGGPAGLSTDFLYLSYTGNGVTPDAASTFDQQVRQVTASRTAAAPGRDGRISYQLPFDTPPALLSPSVALQYSSGGSGHGWVGRGWAVGGHMTLRRPTGGASRAYLSSVDTFVVSGGGLDGVVEKDGNQGWNYVTTSPAPADISFDELTDVWTVRSGGLTTTLEARSTQGPRGPVLWRPSRVEDVSGNHIEYTWFGDRLESIEYGGNDLVVGQSVCGVGDSETYDSGDHTAVVHFLYDDAAHVSTQAQDGFLDTISTRLTAIEIGSSLVDGSVTPVLSRYELTYDTEDEVLLAVDRVSPDGLLSERVASFDYGDLGASVERMLDVDALGDPSLLPPALDLRQQSGRSPFGRSWTTSNVGLSDLSGDGLVDVMWSGLAYWQRMPDEAGSPTEPERWWDLPNFYDEALDEGRPFAQDQHPYLDKSVTVLVWDNDNAWGHGLEEELHTYSTKLYIDVDGDGQVDLLETKSDTLPAAFRDEAGVLLPDNAGARSNNRASCDTLGIGCTWLWSRAVGDGFDDPIEIDAPFQFPRIQRNPHLDYEEAGALATEYPALEGTFVDLLDLDGDGVLDVVAEHPLGLEVWWGNPITPAVAGAEPWVEPTWTSAPSEVLALNHGHTALTRSTGFADLEELEATPDYKQIVPTFAHVETRAGFFDLNGDGLLDYVIADRAIDEWDVYLNKGGSFADVTVWPSPSGYGFVGRSDEGETYGQACAVDEVDLDAMIDPDFTSGEWDGVDVGPAWNPQDMFTYELESFWFLSYDAYGVHDCPTHMVCNTWESLYIAQVTSLYDPSAGDIPEDFGPDLSDNMEAADGSRIDPTSPCTQMAGAPAMVRVGLLDMDGDGRPDLVDTELEQWFRNHGDGFATQANALPSWFPYVTEFLIDGTEIHHYSLSTTRTDQVVVVPDNLTPPSDPRIMVSTGGVLQYHAVMDFDGDGLPDAVDTGKNLGRFSAPGRFDPESPDAWSEHPGLLSRVELGSGATTTLSWAPSSTMKPSGLGADHTMTTHHPVVVEVAVHEPITGQRGRQIYTYEGGVSELGAFWGFETTTRTDYQQSLLADQLATGLPELSPEGRVSEVVTSFLLDRDLTVVSSETLLADANLSHLPPWALEPEAWSVRASTSFSYTEDVTGPVQGLFLTGRHLVDHGYPEPGEPEPAVRVFDKTMSRDDNGLPLTVTHDAVGTDEDVTVAMTWLEKSPGLWVMSSHETSGLDPLTGAADVAIESATFTHDSAGHLVAETICGGQSATDLCDPSQELVWSYTRTGRGSVCETVHPWGTSDLVLAFAFGEAVATDTVNALGHTSTRSVDALGRVVLTTDPNGVDSDSVYDGLGRVVETGHRGAGASSVRRLTGQWVYEHDELPWRDRQTVTTYDEAGSPSSTSETLTVLDGFGAGIQTWTPDLAGTWMLSDTVHDVAGNLLYVSEPRRQVLDFDSSPSWWDLRAPAMARTYADAFGTVRRETNRSTGTTEYHEPEPGVRVTVDAEGYRTTHTFDTQGRLVTVGQNQDGSSTGDTITGSYAYDARGRVVEFVDANSDVYRYTYDGAGRRRTSLRRSEGDATFQTTMRFDWDGPSLVAMFEQDTLEVARFAYDDLLRATEQEVLDRRTGLFDQYSWVYDCQPGAPGSGTCGPTQWLGAVTQQVDPAGVTTFEHGAHAAFGSRGFVTGRQRQWFSTPSVQIWAYEENDKGQARRTQWPSGAVVEHTWHTNGWLDTASVTTATGPVQLTQSYGDWAQPDGWTLQVGSHAFTRTDTHPEPGAPLQTTSLDYDGLPLRSIQYVHDANGWLDTRLVSGFEPLHYEYDHLGRAVELWQGSIAPGQQQESYSFDPLGVPTEMQRLALDVGTSSFVPETWTYDPVDAFHEVASRWTSSGKVDDHSWNAMSRMTGWDTTDPVAGNTQRTFQYDGLGRLVSAVRTGVGAATAEYTYGADDLIVHELRDGVAKLRQPGWQLDGVSGDQLESVLGMLRLVNGEPRVALIEPNGHALSTYDAAGIEQTFEDIGLMGNPLGERNAAVGLPVFALDGLHGAEPDRDHQVVQRGTRHHLHRDGLWMQPEPMLTLGLDQSRLGSPLAFGPAYAAGNAAVMRDADGYALETGWDALNVGLGVISLSTNLASGNWGGALIDGAGLLLDVGATAIPGVPGGAGTAIRLYRGVDTVTTVVQVARRADGVQDALSVAGKGAGAFADVGTSLKVADDIPTPSPAALGDALGDAAKGADAAVDATKRPSGFRKQTVQDAWDNAASGSKPDTKLCPTCKKDVEVAPGEGRRDWDVDHQPPWSTRDLSGKTRKEVLDDYNTGTRLECPGCNRSRGAEPAE